MSIVIIPFVLLIGIVLLKKIPVIGGDIRIGLIFAAISALLLSGVYSPLAWLDSFIFGVDKISWVLALIVLGGIYAEMQVELGAIETVLNVLRAKFGRTPKGLLVVLIVTLVIAGSLLGDAVAACTVIGIMGIQALSELKLKPEQISATIVMGAALGSIMPPITQALFLSASLMSLPSPEPVLNIGYFTVGIGVALCSLYASRWVKIKSLPEELIPDKKASQIFAEGWKTLVPLLVLITIVVLRSGLQIDLLQIFDPIFNPISKIMIIKGLNFRIAKALLVCIIICLFYASIRSKSGTIIKNGFGKVKTAAVILIFAGFMIGAFYKGGQITAVQEFAKHLNEHTLKIGGAVAEALMGMLTGSQSTTQTTIFSVFGPALTAIGVDPVKASVAGAHLAMSGQGLPPADLLTFVVAGLVGGILGVKVDPLRSMIYSSFMCIYFFAVGLLFLYI